MSGLLLLPYVGEYPEEVAAALAEAGTYEWALLATQLGPGPQAYADELNRVWTLCGMANVGLMVVEHDVVIRPTVFDIFQDCPHNYCVFPYWIGASYGYGLGCTRFRRQLIRAHPDLIRAAMRRTNDGLPEEGHWKRMDTRLRDEAVERGILTPNENNVAMPCLHEPPVRHMHKYAMPEPGSPESLAFEQWREEHR